MLKEMIPEFHLEVLLTPPMYHQLYQRHTIM